MKFIQLLCTALFQVDLTKSKKIACVFFCSYNSHICELGTKDTDGLTIQPKFFQLECDNDVFKIFIFLTT